LPNPEVAARNQRTILSDKSRIHSPMALPMTS
jgi:hypothetical protein